MQDEPAGLARRDFLRLTAAGVAAAGLDSLMPVRAAADAQAGTAPAPRSAPEHPLVLQSDLLEVTFDADTGLPFQYRHKPTGATLRGEDGGQPVTVTMCIYRSFDFFQVRAKAVPLPASGKSAAGEVTFQFHVTGGPEEYASFLMHYRLSGASLFITMENVGEEPGAQLIDVAMPRLALVREEDASPWLVYGDTGGKFVMLTDAVPGTLPPNRFWGTVHSTMPITMVGTSHLLCVQETTACMDTTHVEIAGGNGSRVAAIGSGRVHRVNGGQCYDTNQGNGAPLNCGRRGTPNLLVEDTPAARLDFIPVIGDPHDAWIAAGRMVRERMPAMPKQLYHDHWMYGILCDSPGQQKPASTFVQCEKLVSDVADLTDRAAQIVHLWGWQFHGSATGYPAVNSVNERIGGYDGIMRLMKRGHDLNALITLSDNYDDAYKSSPAWDLKMIAWLPDGQLWKSRAWTGEPSYIQGLAKYMDDGPGVDRIHYTCRRYKLPETTYIDTLSYFSIRNDWDRNRPASGIANLRKGRYRIIEEFAKHGVDVTSEAVRYPMIGHISAFWTAQTSDAAPLGGYNIPLLQLVYGKSAVWGLEGGGRNNGFAARARGLFWGANLHAIVNSETDRAEIADMYYLSMVPWLHLHQRAVESFARDGARTTTGYEGGARVEIDWSGQKYRVFLDGKQVADQDAVYCPLDADRICFYSTRAGELSAAWPQGWSAKEAAAAALSMGRRTAANFQVNSDRVSVNVAARQPVIVYRKRGKARL